ncbi:hypothetical protein CcaCcLH18_09947 [Colletotrichum camelliae]|nr:hypothetical protein CcaCcLH18_09947 [Colletotrichum camelliae]
MSNEGTDDGDGVRRNLWPTGAQMAKMTEDKNGEDMIAAETRRQYVSSPFSDSHSAIDFGSQSSTRCPVTGRQILKPVSRKGRAGNTNNNDPDVFHQDSHNNTWVPKGFVLEDVDVIGHPTVRGDFGDQSTPKATRAQPGSETPRTSKALRLHNPEITRSGFDGDEGSPGAGQILDFEPSPKHYLALGMKNKMPSNPEWRQTETPVVTPRKAGKSIEVGLEMRVPDRPQSVKTAPPAMSAPGNKLFVHDPMEMEDDSPSLRPLRRQMGNLKVAQRPPEQAGVRPMDPFVFAHGSELPQTPTKRGRGEFDRTNSLSGRDVAREREILSQYAVATAMEEKHDEDEDEDVEMGEETPKASLLNRHLQEKR